MFADGEYAKSVLGSVREVTWQAHHFVDSTFL